MRLAHVGVVSLAAQVIAEVGFRGYLRVAWPNERFPMANHERLGYYHRPRHEIAHPHAVTSEAVQLRTDDLGVICRSTAAPEIGGPVLLIGDSMVEGLQVHSSENMSEVISRSRGCKTTNLGCSGFSPITYLLTYREFAPRFAAEALIVVFDVGSDYADDARLHHDSRVTYDRHGDVRNVSVRYDYSAFVEWTPQHGLVGLTSKHAWQE
jgi:hypothetical protein